MASDELAESNRRIQELAAALAAERERASAAEASLQAGALRAPPEPGPPQARAAGDPAGDGEWAGRVVDARMFMNSHPVLSGRAAFLRLPSVVTWFGAGAHSSLLSRAARHGRRGGVRQGGGAVGASKGTSDVDE